MEIFNIFSTKSLDIDDKILNILINTTIFLAELSLSYKHKKYKKLN